MTKFNPLHPFPCVYFKHGAYWLVKRGKWERIGATQTAVLAALATFAASFTLLAYGGRHDSVAISALAVVPFALWRWHLKRKRGP